jgi:hypothetical protein
MVLGDLFPGIIAIKLICGIAILRIWYVVDRR